MASDDSSGTKVTQVSDLDFGNPLYLHSSDTSITALISMKLKGTENYNIWSRAMLLALQTKNKTGFIDGSEIKSTTDEKQFDALVKLPSCGCANTEFKNHNDLIKLMQFLMGLDDCYQAVRSNILTRETLPSVQTAFSIVSREESHINSSSSITLKPQQSAFLVSKTFDNKKKFGRGPNTNLKCTKCNMIGHTIDRCYEIVGYPLGWVKRNNNTNRNVTSNNVVSTTNN
ncbi:uncharacterized protein [Rutidosis leptorrhynchoides]|uniref:uncharacterized protein n=1 Tax=Rutidosis leptorrhynchoides TaxID=125765 RepID=UPI003A993AB4